jgi:hypothetical protein
MRRYKNLTTSSQQVVFENKHLNSTIFKHSTKIIH